MPTASVVRRLDQDRVGSGSNVGVVAVGVGPDGSVGDALPGIGVAVGVGVALPTADRLGVGLGGAVVSTGRGERVARGVVAGAVTAVGTGRTSR